MNEPEAEVKNPEALTDVPLLPKISLPQIMENIVYPSSILLIGKKFSGKTNVLLNLLLPVKKKFNNIFVITLSGHTGNLTKLATDTDNILSHITDEDIEFITDFQTENKKATCLMVFDDFIDSERTLRDVKKIMQLATSGRNFRITLVISSQTVAQVPTALRKNAEYLFIGKNMSASARTISEEYANHQINPKQLKQEIINIADRHDWLFYDERKAKWYKLPQEEIKIFV